MSRAAAMFLSWTAPRFRRRCCRRHNKAEAVQRAPRRRCSYCNYTSSDLSNYRRHMNKHTSAGTGPVIPLSAARETPGSVAFDDVSAAKAAAHGAAAVDEPVPDGVCSPGGHDSGFDGAGTGSCSDSDGSGQYDSDGGDGDLPHDTDVREPVAARLSHAAAVVHAGEDPVSNYVAHGRVVAVGDGSAVPCTAGSDDAAVGSRIDTVEAGDDVRGVDAAVTPSPRPAASPPGRLVGEKFAPGSAERLAKRQRSL